MFCDFRICFSEEIDEVRKLLQKFGFDGACIIMEDLSSYEKTKKKILDININNFKFLFGLELSSGKIDLLKNRKEFDYFVFRDPSYNIARMLVNKKKVDCIYFSKKFYFNDILAKKMKQNKIALEFCFNDVLNADGKERSVILWNMIVAAKICKKYGTPYIITSGAKNIFELRNRNSLENFARVLGFQKTKNAFCVPRLCDIHED